jgi:hypothetical protein
MSERETKERRKKIRRRKEELHTIREDVQKAG